MEIEQQIIKAFEELGLAYRWHYLNMSLVPSNNKIRQFQMIVSFFYNLDQAPLIEDIIIYHVYKNFKVMKYIINLQNLNIQNFYLKIYSKSSVLISDRIEKLDLYLLLKNIKWIIKEEIDEKNFSDSNFLINSITKRNDYITQMKFVFGLEESLFA